MRQRDDTQSTAAAAQGLWIFQLNILKIATVCFFFIGSSGGLRALYFVCPPQQWSVYQHPWLVCANKTFLFLVLLYRSTPVFQAIKINSFLILVECFCLPCCCKIHGNCCCEFGVRSSNLNHKHTYYLYSLCGRVMMLLFETRRIIVNISGVVDQNINTRI